VIIRYPESYFQRKKLFELTRDYAKNMILKVISAPDFIPDSPEIWRNYRDHIIRFSTAANEVANPSDKVSDETADIMGEQTAVWFWTHYKTGRFAPDEKKTPEPRKRASYRSAGAIAKALLED
jgi:hypothetical protein